MVEIDIPRLPPSVNHYYGRRGKITFLTKDGIDFRSVVSKAAHEKTGLFTYYDRLEVAMLFTFANKRRCDIDNRVKPLWDALVRCGVIPDDKQIDVAHIRRLYGKEEKTTIVIGFVCEN